MAAAGKGGRSTRPNDAPRIRVEYVTHTGSAHVMRVTGTIGQEYAPYALATLLEAAPEMRDALRDVAAFVFSEVEAHEGYAAALAALCTLKRRVRRALRSAEGTTPPIVAA